MRFPLLVAAFLALAAAGCGGLSQTHDRATTKAPTPQLTIFRVRAGKLRAEAVRVPATTAVAATSLRALGLSGRVDLTNGTARVAAGPLTAAETAELVYTLTQFSTVRRVSLAGGKPISRTGVTAFVPPILVERPAAGAHVGGTFAVAGTASVFEAQFVLELRRNGKLLLKRSVMAAEGAPGRGAFRTIVQAVPGPLTIRAYAPSAADGRPQHEVRVRVVVEP